MLKFITPLSLLLVLWLILEFTGLIPEPLRSYAVQAVKIVAVLVIIVILLAVLFLKLSLLLSLLAIIALVATFTYLTQRFQIDVGIIERKTGESYESRPTTENGSIPFLSSEDAP